MKHVRPLAVVALLSGFAAFLPPPEARAQESGAPGEASRQDVEGWMEELSNRGRWGPDDELGTLNLVTPERRARAAGLVRDGVAVSLSREMEKEEGPDNPDPLDHEVRWSEGRIGWASDRYVIDYHGYAHSHVDALAHTSYEGTFYNGHSTGTIGSDGAARAGIDAMERGVFARGVLIDLPWLLDVPYLEPGTAVTPDVLERWERRTGVRIEPGDVLLIRTGRWARRAEEGPWAAGGNLAGLHASTAPWLHERDPAAIGSDGVTDALPSGIDGFSHPLHQIALVAMGTPLFDNLDLEELAAEAAARERWTFLFTAAPMRVPGGLGAPVNPLAVF